MNEKERRYGDRHKHPLCVIYFLYGEFAARRSHTIPTTTHIT